MKTKKKLNKMEGGGRGRGSTEGSAREKRNEKSKSSREGRSKGKHKITQKRKEKEDKEHLVFNQRFRDINPNPASVEEAINTVHVMSKEILISLMNPVQGKGKGKGKGKGVRWSHSSIEDSRSVRYARTMTGVLFGHQLCSMPGDTMTLYADADRSSPLDNQLVKTYRGEDPDPEDIDEFDDKMVALLANNPNERNTPKRDRHPECLKEVDSLAKIFTDSSINVEAQLINISKKKGIRKVNAVTKTQVLKGKYVQLKKSTVKSVKSVLVPYTGGTARLLADSVHQKKCLAAAQKDISVAVCDLFLVSSATKNEETFTKVCDRKKIGGTRGVIFAGKHAIAGDVSIGYKVHSGHIAPGSPLYQNGAFDMKFPAFEAVTKCVINEKITKITKELINEKGLSTVFASATANQEGEELASKTGGMIALLMKIPLFEAELADRIRRFLESEGISDNKDEPNDSPKEAYFNSDEQLKKDLFSSALVEVCGMTCFDYGYREYKKENSSTVRSTHAGYSARNVENMKQKTNKTQLSSILDALVPHPITTEVLLTPLVTVFEFTNDKPSCDLVEKGLTPAGLLFRKLIRKASEENPELKSSWVLPRAQELRSRRVLPTAEELMARGLETDRSGASGLLSEVPCGEGMCELEQSSQNKSLLNALKERQPGSEVGGLSAWEEKPKVKLSKHEKELLKALNARAFESRKETRPTLWNRKDNTEDDPEFKRAILESQIATLKKSTQYEQIAQNVLAKMATDPKLLDVKHDPTKRISRRFSLTIDPSKDLIECIGDYLECIKHNHTKIHQILNAESTQKTTNSEKKYTKENVERSASNARAEARAEMDEARAEAAAAEARADAAEARAVAAEARADAAEARAEMDEAGRDTLGSVNNGEMGSLSAESNNSNSFNNFLRNSKLKKSTMNPVIKNLMKTLYKQSRESRRVARVQSSSGANSGSASAGAGAGAGSAGAGSAGAGARGFFHENVQEYIKLYPGQLNKLGITVMEESEYHNKLLQLIRQEHSQPDTQQPKTRKLLQSIGIMQFYITPIELLKHYMKNDRDALMKLYEFMKGNT